jgi:hypothetical protein
MLGLREVLSGCEHMTWEGLAPLLCVCERCTDAYDDCPVCATYPAVCHDCRLPAPCKPSHDGYEDMVRCLCCGIDALVCTRCHPVRPLCQACALFERLTPTGRPQLEARPSQGPITTSRRRANTAGERDT